MHGGVLVLVTVLVVIGSGLVLVTHLGDKVRWNELHSALGTTIGLVARDVRMHRADVGHFGGRRRCEQLHPTLGT